MTFGKQLVQTNRKGMKIFFGTFLLLFIEFFVLVPLIGGFALLIMAATFFGAIFLIYKLQEPMLEKAGDLMEQKANPTKDTEKEH